FELPDTKELAWDLAAADEPGRASPSGGALLVAAAPTTPRGTSSFSHRRTKSRAGVGRHRARAWPRTRRGIAYEARGRGSRFRAIHPRVPVDTRARTP